MKHLKLTYTDINKMLASICRDIANSNWRPDYVIGITRGGLTPAVMISQYFNCPMKTLKVSLRDGGDTESNYKMAEDAFDGKNILIIDDINDTGATINWIVNNWQDCCHPQSEVWKDQIWNSNVRIATVIDNLSSDCKIKVDYVGMEINKANDDVWVDFPWEVWWTL
jgi:hypothetical protein